MNESWKFRETKARGFCCTFAPPQKKEKQKNENFYLDMKHLDFLLQKHSYVQQCQIAAMNSMKERLVYLDIETKM